MSGINCLTSTDLSLNLDFHTNMCIFRQMSFS